MEAATVPLKTTPKCVASAPWCMMASFASKDAVREPLTNCCRRSAEKSLKRGTLCLRNSAVFMTHLLVKERIDHAELYAPVVAAVIAIVDFLEAVEAFEPDAQALAQLPDDVRARVVGGVIEGAGLSGSIVEVDITVSE